MDQKLSPGEEISGKSDEEGWCYVAVCTSECVIQKLNYLCTTTRPTTTATTKKPPKNCTYEMPPREHGETWVPCSCIMNTCEDGVVISNHKDCKEPVIPICANGYPPVRVFDDPEECCFHFECQYIFTGWGDGHYVTFDGTYYTHHKNCTYVLVKEITIKYHFKILISNQHCDWSKDVACVRTLTVFYNNYIIILKQVQHIKFLVSINGENIYPSYNHDGIIITTTSIELILRIQEIHLFLVFTENLFSIELPATLFHGNLEGLGGKADNDSSNDCYLPNGEASTDCSRMADEWLVDEHKEEYCVEPPPPPTPGPDCNVNICEVLKSSVFEACHGSVSVDVYYNACKADPCKSCCFLEAYAQMCSSLDMCVHWRNHTSGVCEYQCPGNKVYKACGPTFEETCNARLNEEQNEQCNGMGLLNDPGCTAMVEGCYCSDTMTMFSPSSDICVSSCCTGPDGNPKGHGESWLSNCERCYCEEYTDSVMCEPIKCQPQMPVTCTKDGEVLTNQTVDCCTKQVCECNVKYCPVPSVLCELGFELKVTMPDDSCCPVYTCVPKLVCVYNNTEYKTGHPVPQDPCGSCVCSARTNPETKLQYTDCTTNPCNVLCSEGYEYESVTGQCCGQCKQKRCVFDYPGIDTPVVIDPSNTWTPPNESCTKYSCSKDGDNFIVIKTETPCADYNPDNCIPGTETTYANGCCRSCVPLQDCAVTKNVTRLKIDDCISTNEVELTGCAGTCGLSSSRYSVEMKMFIHECKCCKELETTEKTVVMDCAGKVTKSYVYLYVEKCSCEECVYG